MNFKNKKLYEFSRILFVIAFLALEVFILSNWKYDIIHKYFMDYIFLFIQEYLFDIKIATLIVILLINLIVWVQIKKRKKLDNVSTSFLLLLTRGFQGKMNSVSGVLNSIILVVHIAWFGDYLIDADSLDFIKALLILAFMTLFILLNIILFINNFRVSNNVSSRKVLITALPKLYDLDIISTELKKYGEEILNRNSKIEELKLVKPKNSPISFTDSPWQNLDPIRKYLLHFESIEKVYFFCSNVVIQNETEFKYLKDILSQFNSLSNRDISYDFNGFEISDPKIGFDADSIENTKDYAERLLNYIFTNTNYKDSDLMFNLTSSTSIVTSIFTLKSIRENREAYHINQTTGEIMSVSLDVLTTQELWDELFEKLE